MTPLETKLMLTWAVWFALWVMLWLGTLQRGRKLQFIEAMLQISVLLGALLGFFIIWN